MIYSLYPLLKETALNVQHNDKPVSYDGGNMEALHRWIQSMNAKQIEANLGIEGSRKYPLIWLVEGWKGNEFNPGIKFTGVTFYIAINSKVELLNKNRIENFEILYKVANDFIKGLKRFSKINESDINYFERPSFKTEAKKETKGAVTSDIWDALVVNLDLHIVSVKKCFN